MMWLVLVSVISIYSTSVHGYSFHTGIPPRIGIASWMTVENSRNGRNEWEHGGLARLLLSGAVNVERTTNGTTIIISPHLDKVRIVCNASYPVRWHSPESEYRPDDLHNTAFFIYETRYVKTVRDPKTFVYQSTLEIEDNSDGISRNFHCQSLANPQTRRNLYIYWEGNALLSYAGEVIDVRTTDNETIILPCTVTRPDAYVYLLKESNDGEREFPRNGSIRYSPDVGFTLLLNKLEDPYGRYRCISDDEEETGDNDERSVRLNVLHGFHQDYYSPNIKFNSTIKSNASFTYDEESWKFICCSSSWKPPNLKVIYCSDRLTCKSKEHFLTKISSGHIRWTANGSCTSYEVFRKNSGILRCRGDDIDIFKTYFTAITNPFSENDTVKVYYSLTGMPEENLVTVLPSDLFQPIYSEQNFSAYCDTSDFYFSKGIQWAIKYKNNSLQFLTETSNPYADDKFTYGTGTDFNAVVITAEMDIESLVCYAPVWNSTDWVKKETPLNVKESTVPFVYMQEEGTINWILNETGKTITCEVTGDPLPFIHWRKDNKTLLISDYNLDLIHDYENGTSVLNITRVGHDAQGEYICTGINFAGEDQKFVRVVVLEPPTTTSAGLIIFISTAVCFSLLLILFLLIWKLKLQKNIIEHLAGVVFRDVGK